METWISGPAIARDHAAHSGQTAQAEPALTADTIAKHADAGDRICGATIDRFVERTARGLAMVVNIVDPEVIVLGGGLSQINDLAPRLTKELARHVFAEGRHVDVRTAKWGDASGVRGAARL